MKLNNDWKLPLNEFLKKHPEAYDGSRRMSNEEHIKIALSFYDNKMRGFEICPGDILLFACDMRNKLINANKWCIDYQVFYDDLRENFIDNIFDKVAFEQGELKWNG